MTDSKSHQYIHHWLIPCHTSAYITDWFYVTPVCHWAQFSSQWVGNQHYYLLVVQESIQLMCCTNDVMTRRLQERSLAIVQCNQIRIQLVWENTGKWDCLANHLEYINSGYRKWQPSCPVLSSCGCLIVSDSQLNINTAAVITNLSNSSLLLFAQTTNIENPQKKCCLWLYAIRHLKAHIYYDARNDVGISCKIPHDSCLALYRLHLQRNKDPTQLARLWLNIVHY